MEVAQWMLAQVEENDELLQVRAAADIRRLFGTAFVYSGIYGELAIDKRVLSQFRKLSGDAVVWVAEPGGAYWEGAHWRKRCAADLPGRTQSRYS